METQDSTTQQQRPEEERQSESPQPKHVEPQSNQDPAEVEAALVSHLDKMFEIENLKTQPYLLKNLDSNLHIPVKTIIYERSVQAISNSYKQIESAIQKCKNLDYEKGPFVRVKATSERRTVLVKNISQTNSLLFRKLVDDLCANDENTKQFKYEFDPKTDTVSLTFQDENATVGIFSQLLEKTFQDKPVDCLIKDSNSHLELNEHLRNTRQYPPFGYFGQPMMYRNNYHPMMMPPYRPHNKYSNYNKRDRDAGNNTREDGVQQGGQRQDYPQKNYGRKYDGKPREPREGGDRKYNNKRQQGYKKVLSKEEIEKVTSVNAESYPPLH